MDVNLEKLCVRPKGTDEVRWFKVAALEVDAPAHWGVVKRWPNGLMVREGVEQNVLNTIGQPPLWLLMVEGRIPLLCAEDEALLVELARELADGAVCELSRESADGRWRWFPETGRLITPFGVATLPTHAPDEEVAAACAAMLRAGLKSAIGEELAARAQAVGGAA